MEKTKNNKVTHDTYRRCIAIIIEMKRNLIEYKNAFGYLYPGILCFDLNEIPSIETTDNQKRVVIEYNADTDKYRITTLFDGNELSNEVSSDKLPVSTIISLFELFNDIRTYWVAFENFSEQQQEILTDIPAEHIVERLTKYMEKNTVTIYSDCSTQYEINKDTDIPSFLKEHSISYLNVYRSVFFNIGDY